MKKNKEKNSLKKNFFVLIKGYKLLYAMYGKYLIWNIVVNVISCITPFFTLYMTSLVVNSLAYEKRFYNLINLVIISTLGLFCLRIFERIIRRQVNIFGSDQWRKDSLYYMNIQNKMKYSYLEDANIRLKFENIQTNKFATGAGPQILMWETFNFISSLINIIMSVSLTVSLFTNGFNTDYNGSLSIVNSIYAIIFISGLILCNAIVSVYLTNTQTKKIENEWKGFSKENISWKVFSHLFSSDTAIFNIDKIVSRELEKRKKPAYLMNSQKVEIKYTFLRTTVNFIVTLILFIFIACKVYIGAIGIGSFILYRGTLHTFVSSVADISSSVGRIAMNNPFMEDIYSYLDLPNDINNGELLLNKSSDNYEIEFRNVSFKYPGSSNWALRNVSIKLKPGNKIAIVGENGSGKTTFIKLLCRLYDPDEGCILLNGIDITSYKYEEYISILAIVFQDYKLFSFSIANNISAKLNYEKERAYECIRKVGLYNYISSLSKGVDTCLNRDYVDDGINVSGGEAQKIAIARALYKDSFIFICDEPTASLDPRSEAEIYNQLDIITNNKTSIFISHRLSSCRLCDCIYVFEKGNLIEQGSHNELMENKEGKYYELWSAQAKYYIE